MAKDERMTHRISPFPAWLTLPPPQTPGAKEPGPWTGIEGFSLPQECSVPLPVPLGKQGAVRFWIRLNRPILSGPGVATDGGTVLELPGLAKANLWWYSGYGGIVWEGTGEFPSLSLEVPGLPGPQWLHLCYTWDAGNGLLAGYLNGTPLRLEGTRLSPWSVPVPVSSLRLPPSERWALAGLAVADRPVSRDEVLAAIPSIYRGALDHPLGAQELGRLDPASWRGDLFYENPLARPEDVTGWRVEGPGEISFSDGCMRMWSREAEREGKEGHVVFWCDREFPADVLLEFEVRIRSPRGLNILFFCAKGCRGEDVFDPTLKPRTGIFGHYTNGDINCYHVSYYAHTPNAGGRPTSNLRKNKGFFLVDNGPVGIPPGNTAVHHAALLKRGGAIQFAIDGRRVIHWHDDGVHYGPVLGEGKVAFRQMKWTVAEYRNLRVFHIPPHA